MQRALLLNAMAVPLLLVGLVSVEVASGDDLRRLTEAYFASCNETMKYTEYAGSSFCQRAYTEFVNSFRGRSPAGWMQSAWWRTFYTQYFETALFPTNFHDNALFWGATYKLQRQVLEEIRLAKGLATIYATRIVEDMNQYGVDQWCSDDAGAVFVNRNCSPNSIVKEVFWREASVMMAERVRGNFFYLTQKGYFKKDSGFGKYELNTLLMRSSFNREITVLNVIPHASWRTCYSKYLRELQELTRQKFDLYCYDVYGEADRVTPYLMKCI